MGYFYFFGWVFGIKCGLEPATSGWIVGGIFAVQCAFWIADELKSPSEPAMNFGSNQDYGPAIHDDDDDLDSWDQDRRDEEDAQKAADLEYEIWEAPYWEELDRDGL